VPDQVRWFEPLGQCECGKPATGTLRGVKNESYGYSCLKCANKRLKRAERDRAAYVAFALKAEKAGKVAL
jgi:hypothetical protein